jgi:hypothetical protein
VDNEIGRRNIEQMIVRDTPQEQTRPQPNTLWGSESLHHLPQSIGRRLPGEFDDDVPLAAGHSEWLTDHLGAMADLHDERTLGRKYDADGPIGEHIPIEHHPVRSVSGFRGSDSSGDGQAGMHRPDAAQILPGDIEGGRTEQHEGSLHRLFAPAKDIGQIHPLGNPDADRISGESRPDRHGRDPLDLLGARKRRSRRTAYENGRAEDPLHGSRHVSKGPGMGVRNEQDDGVGHVVKLFENIADDFTDRLGGQRMLREGSGETGH